MNNKNNDSNNNIPNDELILIGDLLKNARQKKGIELRLISQKTRINFKILDNLEKNNMNELPNKTYVKGFVQTYAKELDIDREYALECLRYSYEYLEHEPTNKSKFAQAEPIEPNENLKDIEKIAPSSIKISNKKISIIAGGAGIIIILIALIIILSSNDTTGPEVPEVNVVDQPTPQNATTDETPAATIKPEETIAIKQEAPKVEERKNLVPTPSPTKEIEKPVTLTKEMFPEIEFKEFTEGPLFSLNDKASELSDPAILPPNIKNAMSSDKQNVYINAYSGDTWISYKKDDSKVRNFILRKGRTLFISGEEILLFFGNVNSVKLFYNNKLVDSKSKSGVKSLVFPEENKKDHFIPLFARDKMGNSYSGQEYIEARKKFLDDKED